MAHPKNHFFKKRPLIERMLWLAGAFLSLVLLTSCSNGETKGNAEKTNTGTQVRPEILEGINLTREKKYEDATTVVYSLIDKNPKDAEALAVMSYIFAKSSRLQKAREMADRALKIDSYMSLPYIVLARVQFQKSDFNEALDLARQALVLDPNIFEAYQVIGEIYLRQGLFKDAVTVLKEAVRLDPENPKVMNLLSSSFIKDKQYDQALVTLTALQKIDPNYPGAHLNLALLYAKLKNGSKAMRHIAKAEYLYAQDDNKPWLSKTRDIRRVIARDFKLRPEDIN